jgi:hypothetical protein
VWHRRDEPTNAARSASTTTRSGQRSLRRPRSPASDRGSKPAPPTNERDRSSMTSFPHRAGAESDPRTCGICKLAKQVETQASLRHTHAAHVPAVQVPARLRRLPRWAGARMAVRGSPQAALGPRRLRWGRRSVRLQSDRRTRVPALLRRAAGRRAAALRQRLFGSASSNPTRRPTANPAIIKSP